MKLILLLSYILGVLAEDNTKVTYASLEKQRFIYGKPGDKDYGKPRSPKDIDRLERMWVLDLDIQKIRGFIQGYHRGMYKDFDWQLPEVCINKNFVLYMYWLEVVFNDFFGQIVAIVALAYAIYFNIDNQCLIEQYIYDMSQWCFDHDCGFYQLL